MIRFGNFFVLVPERQLCRDGKTLVLRERAFEVLLALIEQAGQVVSKRDLCRRAWPERDVDENNLQVEILGLRKLLGRNAIVTAAGRGYQFALPVVTTLVETTSVETTSVETTSVETTSVETTSDAMAEESILIGRDEDLKRVEALLAPGVLVTVVGEGGIGKSQLAHALAKRHEAYAPGSTCLVALDAAQDGDQARLAVAGALQLPPGTDNGAAPVLRSALRERRLLLVLDGCDQAVQAVAELVSMILDECTGVSLLATTREVLRVPGERVYRLGALALGADADAATRDECDAARLFRHALPSDATRVEWTDATRAAVGDICRQLEGNPLAIKLAARRAGELGVDALHRRLAERLDLLQDADPGAPLRQQSLRASLDWSYELLPAVEQRVFRELATLAQPFTLSELLALRQRPAPDPWDTMEALTRLVDKSLVAIDSTDPPNYRLSETTMLFALELINGATPKAKLGAAPKGKKT